jgi:amino acid adenylation domain-containing protein
MTPSPHGPGGRDSALVHRWVEEQARRRPGAPAVISDGTTLTYHDLNARANQLARHLQASGAGPGTIVGIYLERSPDMITALLAVLKAGAAYLPLDPAYPPARLRYMINDSATPLIITNSTLAPDIPAPPPNLLLLDTHAPHITTRPATNPTQPHHPDQLAYTIYTSGSTGTPKGVTITHRGITNLVDWHIAEFTITADDRTSSLSALSFDAAGWEIWPQLAAGGCLMLAPDSVKASATRLGNWLAEAQVTVAFVPTVMMPDVTDTLGGMRSSLRVVLTGGDRLSLRSARMNGYSAYNAYGPTESSIVTTCGPIGEDSRDGQDVAIGREITGTTVYLLDEHLRLTEDGAVGEIYIASAGLARGYHARAAETAARFLPDPYGAIPGRRMYATGDLARRDAAGRLWFTGRVDDQVQVNGQRVEPAEVESVLATHERVRLCAVVAERSRSCSATRLVAYVVANDDDGAAADFRGYLAGKLPRYMVPAEIRITGSLPLTPSGKLDRQALAARPATVSPAGSEPTGPTQPAQAAQPVDAVGEVAQLVARTWADVLGQDTAVGPEDDFFALGGDSLAALAAAASLEEQLQREVPLYLLFEHSRLSEYAARLSC